MKLTTKQVVEQISQFWKAQSAKRKKIIIGSGAGLLAIAIVLTLLVNNSGYVTLYSGLSSEELGKIASVLSDKNVDFKTDGDAILVPGDQEAELQMTLASEGYPQSTFNYDIFSSNSGYMTTDFEKRQYLLFQLQDRLQAAIKTIDGVNDAIVTISLPEEDSFILEEDKTAATASVVLDLDPSVQLDSKQVRGIESLVCKSVTGLDKENVAIVSTTGEMLNDTNASDTNANNRLALEKSISASIQNNIMKLLDPIFGSDKVRVAVNTSVDINKKVSESTSYSPVTNGTGIVANQDSSKENTSSSSGTGASGVAGTSSNTGVTTYPQVTNSGTTGNYSESNSVNYLNNQLIEQTERDGYEVSGISISVLIGDSGLAPSEIKDYQKMVAYAAGVTTDQVVITNVDFNKAANANNNQEYSGIKGFIYSNLYLVVALAVVVIVMIFVLIMFLKKKGKKKGKKRGKKRGKDDSTDTGEFWNQKTEDINANMQGALPMPQEIVLNETREQNLKRQIKDFSSGNPDIVAQLIRTWIKEEDEK